VTVLAARARFEHLLADANSRPADRRSVCAALSAQIRYQPKTATDGLDALAQILAAHFDAAGDGSPSAVAELARRHPSQPLIQVYAFTIRRERGDAAGAAESLERLRDADPDDPMAAMWAAAMSGQPIVAASEETRLANIAKLAATPLLSNHYRLAVGAIFEAIRGRERARVLDVGVGSGAQMLELLGLLQCAEHYIRQLELVGLDFVDEFLQAAGGRINEAATGFERRLGVSFEPVNARIEALDAAAIDRIRGPDGLDAANATIALHEVPGERKLDALRNLRALSPRRLVLAEWNYRLENTLPETSTRFVFGARSAAAAIVSALTGRHSLAEARAVVRDWLSQGGGQLTVPAAERQECFLDAPAWRTLLEHTGFTILAPGQSLLAHAQHANPARVHHDGCWIETSRYAGMVPIALLLTTPTGPR
jgi:hypothetical protein